MASARRQVTLGRHDGLIVVDVQRCFLPGGSLAVPDGDRVIGPLNRTVEKFQRQQLPVFYARDWHTPDHISFQERGGPWPPHCIQDSEGASFAPGLKVPENATIISKGTRRDEEEYSALAGRDGDRSLKEILSGSGIERVFVGGRDRLLRAQYSAGRGERGLPGVSAGRCGKTRECRSGR